MNKGYSRVGLVPTDDGLILVCESLGRGRRRRHEKKLGPSGWLGLSTEEQESLIREGLTSLRQRGRVNE